MLHLSDFTRNWRPVRHVWPLVAAAGLGLAVAVAAWFAVSVWEERLARAKFTAVAGDYATALQNGLDQYLGKILAVRAFYEASVEVDSDEFNLFTSQIVAGYDGAMRLVWSPRVARDERAEFEHKARERGIADYAVRTWAVTGPMPVSPERDEYFPILYSTVATKRAATLGTDLNSEPTRSDAIRRARDGNIMATAQGIMLRNPIDGLREGFLAMIPVYRHGLAVGSIDDRRRNTLGVLAGVFQTAAVFDAILDRAKLPQNVNLYLYPARSGHDPLPVYMRGAASRDQPLEAKSENALAGSPHQSTSLKAGDASWHLVVVPLEGG